MTYQELKYNTLSCLFYIMHTCFTLQVSEKTVSESSSVSSEEDSGDEALTDQKSPVTQGRPRDESPNSKKVHIPLYIINASFSLPTPSFYDLSGKKASCQRSAKRKEKNKSSEAREKTKGKIRKIKFKEVNLLYLLHKKDFYLVAQHFQ